MTQRPIQSLNVNKGASALGLSTTRWGLRSLATNDVYTSVDEQSAQKTFAAANSDSPGRYEVVRRDDNGNWIAADC